MLLPNLVNEQAINSYDLIPLECYEPLKKTDYHKNFLDFQIHSDQKQFGLTMIVLGMIYLQPLTDRHWKDQDYNHQLCDRRT